jgi:hypothetical protein
MDVVYEQVWYMTSQHPYSSVVFPERFSKNLMVIKCYVFFCGVPEHAAQRKEL